MEYQTENKELNSYIAASIQKGTPQEEIVDTLLAKGWLIGEIRLGLMQNGSQDDEHSLLLRSDERKEKFAVYSVALFLIALVAYFINFLLICVLVAFSGFVLGIVGIRSHKKGFAVSGTILNLLMLVWIIFSIATFVYMVETGTFPFTGEPLTEQEKIDFGISEFMQE